MSKIRLVFGMILMLCLGGCAGSLNGEPNFNLGVLSPTTPSTSSNALNSIPDVCNNLLSTVPGDAVDAVQRDSCIFAVMDMIDQSYYEYRKTLFSLVNTGNAATDILGIGISSAATLVAGATTKTILSAINTGLSGAKAKVDSDVLYSKSISLILTQMDADRADWKSRILAQINDPQKSSTYSMYQAATDLLSYYEAGTWDNALISLDTQTSSNLNNCQAAVKNAQTTDNTGVSTQCGPQATQVVTQIVTVVPQDVQTHREALAAYVKTLSSADLDKLAGALGTTTGADALLGILDYLDNATTPDQVNTFASEINVLFGKDI